MTILLQTGLHIFVSDCNLWSRVYFWSVDFSLLSTLNHTKNNEHLYSTLVSMLLWFHFVHSVIIIVCKNLFSPISSCPALCITVLQRVWQTLVSKELSAQFPPNWFEEIYGVLWNIYLRLTLYLPEGKMSENKTYWRPKLANLSRTCSMQGLGPKQQPDNYWSNHLTTWAKATCRRTDITQMMMSGFGVN